MKVLLTGGDGVLGSVLGGHLVAQGYAVRALLPDSSPCSWLTSLPGTERVHGGMERMESLEQALQGVDAVLHAAELTHSWSPNDLFACNVQGTENLLVAIHKKAPGIKRVVLLSSLEAVGPSADGVPLEFGCAPHPVSPYGCSKQAAEQVASAKAGELPITVLRPAWVYGPHDRSLLGVCRSLSWGFLPFIQQGENRFSWVYANDVAWACIKAMEADVPSGNAYFVDDGFPLAWREVLQSVEHALGQKAWLRKGVPMPLVWSAAFLSDRLGGVKRPAPLLTRAMVDKIHLHWVCSSAKTCTDLAWSPRVSWQEGLCNTLHSYAAQCWISSKKLFLPV